MMAYLAFDFENGAQALDGIRDFRTDTHFTAREWQVIRLARVDGMHALGEPSRLGRMISMIFGERPANPLADTQLEALRRAAAYLWHRSMTLTTQQIDNLYAEGYSFRQIASLSSFVARSRRKSL
jgi:hypothetical protein